MEKYTYIFDIDGVIADIEHRLKYARNKDYEKFYSDEEMIEDKEIRIGLELLRNLKRARRDNTEIVFATGRPEKTRRITKIWLQNNSLPTDNLYMRKDGDYRPSDVVKVELVSKIMKDLNINTDSSCVMFIDDDPKNVIAIEKKFGIRGLIFGTNRIDEIKALRGNENHN